MMVPDPNAAVNHELTFYSNYIIFKNSFWHLVHHQDIYIKYADEHIDFFKYSPAFALAMAPFAVLPDLAGLFLWNFINIFVLFFALWSMPIVPEKKKLLAMLFIIMEAITAMGNSQSNSLMAGLFILAFLFLEKNNVAIATLFIVITVFIKLFGLVGFALFLLYPNKIKAMAYTIFWFVLFALIPMLIVSPSELVQIYKSWWNLLSNDYVGFNGISVIAWLNTWFGLTEIKQMVVIFGLIIFGLPLIRFKQFVSQKFRMFFLASILLWVVLFNHRAESPTFVIAVSGVAIWFFGQTQNIFNLVLILIALVFTILAPTDIFPAHIRNDIFVPYAVKVVPCFFIWLKLIYDMLKVDFLLDSELKS